MFIDTDGNIQSHFMWSLCVSVLQDSDDSVSYISRMITGFLDPSNYLF